MFIAEEELDLGLHRSPLDDLELLRGWDLVVELLRGWGLVVLQEPVVLVDSLELWELLLAFSSLLVVSSQVLVSTLPVGSFSLDWG